MIYKNTRGCDLNVRTPKGFSIIKPNATVSLSGKFAVMNRHKIVRGYLTPSVITEEVVEAVKKVVEVATKVDEIIDIVTKEPEVVVEEPKEEKVKEEVVSDSKTEKPKRRKRRTKEEIEADEA